MSEVTKEESEVLLPKNKLLGVVAKIRQEDGGENVIELLSERLRDLGAADHQIAFFSNVLYQIQEDIKISNLRLEEKDINSIHEMELYLAGRLNSMASFLLALSPEKREEQLSTAESVAGLLDPKKWTGIKRGLVGTTGSFLLMQKLAPESDIRLPTPEEDVDRGVDLVVGNIFIQVKTKKGEDCQVFTDPEALASYYATRYSLSDVSDTNKKQFVERLERETADFRRLTDYAGEKGKAPVFLVLPSSFINSQNCEPQTDNLPEVQEIINSLAS